MRIRASAALALADLEIDAMDGERRTQRARRQERQGIARVALVGYTNAGKSTLMRALTGNEVLVADKLFATLDTTTRRVWLESDGVHPGVGVTLSDKGSRGGRKAAFRTLDRGTATSELIAVSDGFEQVEVVEVLDMVGEGADVVGGTPAELGAYLKREIERYSGIIKSARIKGD